MDSELLLKIIDTYGIENQMMQCIEEMGELIQAINKYRRAEFSVSCIDAYNQVIEEIADVQIMIEQMRMIFNEDDVDKVIAEKLERMRERLKLKGGGTDS